MPASDDKGKRYEKGMAALKLLSPEGADSVPEGLRDLAPEMGNFIVEFAYGDVFSRAGLDPKSRQIATISALTALGNAEPQLRWHIAAGLNVGITPEQMVDIMYISTVYQGFPAGLNGIAAVREVFRQKSIAYAPVKRSPVPDRRKTGLESMEVRVRGEGERTVNNLKDIAPEMAGFVIDFSYGDVISRGNLLPKEAELVAIAGMCAAGTERPQLIVHIKYGLGVGLTKEQILEVIMQMAVFAGFPAALNGISAAREAFASVK